jgi:hypothetical protein
MKATATKMITAAIAAIGLVGFAVANVPDSPDVPVNDCQCPARFETRGMVCLLVSCGDICVYECHALPQPSPW